MKQPGIADVPLHPFLEAVLDFTEDMLTPNDLADITGFHRITVCQAFRNGTIPSTGIHLRTKGRADGRWLRRQASKAAIIEWLWDREVGERTMMRAVLAKRAPMVLKTLEARDAARAADEARATAEADAGKKIIRYPGTRRNSASATPPDCHQSELSLFTA